jgi:hypothetical protein
MAPADRSAEHTWVSRSHPVEEDMRLQRAMWRFERCGWAALGVIIGLALLGLFANGPLSSASATDGSGRLRVEYERFQRNGAGTSMQVHVDAAGQQGVAVRLNADFLRSFQIEALHPEPAAQHGAAGGVEMVFHPPREGALTIHYVLRPRTVGPVRNEIGMAGEAPARFINFVFP